MHPRLRKIGRWIARLGAAMLMLFCLWAAAYVIGSYRFRTYTLPNGMIVKREYADWLLTHEYYDIYAPDGVTLRIPDVWMICFNDRFLEASGWRREDGGIFDGYDNGRPLSGSEYTAANRELSQPWRSCNGYFTGWLGPELLYPDNRPPFLAPANGETATIHRCGTARGSTGRARTTRISYLTARAEGGSDQRWT